MLLVPEIHRLVIEMNNVTYVTDAMNEARGQWTDSRTSPPIALSDIRKWAMATYWPETPPKIYWDADYAKTTRWAGIIAPPDFNPFAWMIERPTGTAIPQPEKTGGGNLTGMNGGQTDTYGTPMRPDDVITSQSRLVDWHEREGRLGWTLYVTSEVEWRNQNSDLVRKRMSISVRY